MPDKTSTGYAIIDYAGKQFRVAAGQELKVPHTGGEAGGNLQLERVLMLKENGATHFGSPTVEGATVDATLLGHGRERKIIVFKFRRRKGYRRKAGHRQDYSLLRINGINLAKLKPVSEETAAEKPATAIPKTAAKPAPKKKARAETAKAKPAVATKVVSGKEAEVKKAGTTKKVTGAAKGTAEKSTATKKSTVAKKTSAAKKSTTTEKSAETKKSTSAKKSTGAVKKPAAKKKAKGN